MKILVTGSSGFIGRAVVEHLIASGHEVIGLHAHAKTITSALHRDLVADIASTEEIALLSKEIEPCDAIVHTAASLDMGLHSTDVSRVNCIGLQNVLWLASQWIGNQFIFLSSVPVIGIPRIFPITEDHPVEPLTAYHASKLFGEQIVRLAEKQGINTVSLRLSAPVGPGMPKNRLLSVFVRRALNGEPLEISGQGTRKQNYIDTRDIAKATELCLQGNVSGVFNIAASRSISNIDLAKLCIARCDSSSATLFNGRADSEEGYTWDISIEKAKTALGFVPKFDIDDAIDAAKNDLAENYRAAE